MAIQFSVTVRDARLEAIETATGTAAVLKIFTGAQPANCATANSGTELVSMTLPSDYLAAASGGSKAKTGTWQGTAIASGTAGHFRLYASNGTTCHQQGSVSQRTADGGTGDMRLEQATAAIASGQVVTISTFTLTDANA
jgi:hypothetical protein